MILYPFAKLNLGLDILNRRPDGYHDISTLFIPTDWRDILEILPSTDSSEDSKLTVTGNRVDCPQEKNLVMKAYRALEKTYSLPPVSIHLHKIIPDGAGLGGGSADAAFTLTALNEMFSLGLSREELCRIASSIGADCPYFICGGAMMASGTGTDLTPFDISQMKVDLREFTLVIVKPPVSMPTREAYAGVTPHIPSRPLSHRLLLPVEEWQTAIVNDFERSVFTALHEVKNIKECLSDAGAVYASMSGSGTAVYALFGGDILADTLSTLFPDCMIHVGKITL